MNRYPALAASPLSAIAPVEPVLNVTDIQGNIVAGFNKDYQTFLFLRMVHPKKPKPVRKWIRGVLAPQLASTDQVLAFNRLFRATRGPAGESAVKATWINAAFSSECLRALLSPAETGTFGDEAFQTGLAARSEFLGDPSKRGAPGNKHAWKVGGPSNPADIVLIVASDEEKWRKATVLLLLATLPAAGLELVFRQDGATLPNPWRGHEHFGFKDGISQPALRGRASAAPSDFIARRFIDPSDLRSLYFAKPGQMLVWPGEFVLGLPRQQVLTTDTAPAPAATNFPPWARDGSYLVIRRMRQDTGAFAKFVANQAARLGISSEEFGSRLVGRWPSGAPIMRSPSADNTALAADDLANNHFAFNRDSLPVPLVPIPGYPGDGFPQASADFLGSVCPHFAHIRKVNPRDGATDLGVAQDTHTRFLLRRGIPYGKSVLGVASPTPQLTKADRGLVFASYQSSIVDQFETVIRRWSNTPNLPTLGGHDPIIGQEESHGSRDRFIELPDGRCILHSEWVTATGGGYFFAPSISAVRDVLGI